VRSGTRRFGQKIVAVYYRVEPPVVVLDESLRFAATHHMSASRFLLELATRRNGLCFPRRFADTVSGPPGIDQRR
jgi:hypothetical protein